MTSGYVYLIHYTGCIYKAGYTKHLKKRLIQLQRHVPFNIRLHFYKWYDDVRRAERFYLDKFGLNKIRKGEFLKLTDEEVNIFIHLKIE